MSNITYRAPKIISGLTDVEWNIQTIPTVVAQNASLSADIVRKTNNPAASRLPSHEYLWLKPTIDHLEKLLQLEEDWDSYGAAPIEFENAEYAVRLLDFVMASATPAPFIAPTSGGSIQLEWHCVGIDLEIEILSPYRLFVSYEDENGTTDPWEGEITTDLTKVREAIEELSRRT